LITIICSSPLQKGHQTLRDAYTVTKGLGPSIVIDAPNDSRWLSIYVERKSIGNVAFFSRMFFHTDCTFVTSPKTHYLPDPDFIAMRYEELIDTFSRYFMIATPESLGLASIPSPPPIN
jgi:hypothetical protein